jgi:hypothetical protein
VSSLVLRTKTEKPDQQLIFFLSELVHREHVLSIVVVVPSIKLS